MNIPDVMLAVADHIYMYGLSVIVSLVIALSINYKFTKKFFSGLLLLQVSLTFNAAFVIFGLLISKVSIIRVIHYFFFELFTVLGIYAVYIKIINKRHHVITRLRQSNSLIVSVVLLAFNLMLIMINIKNVANDGTSRIAFMTSGWFSYVRPFISIMAPLSYFYSIFLFENKNRALATIILGSSVLANILSGSKASFALAILTAFLLYRDIKVGTILIPNYVRNFLVACTTILIILTISRLNVSLADVGERVMLTGDATIMVYYSEHPEWASSGVSTLAKVHRGFAKLLGDPSANNKDTLFGFALNIVETGENSFTGPNASIPAYMLCNYRGIMNFIGIASIIGYLFFIRLFLVNIILNAKIFNSILLLPFAVSSLATFPQDYYAGMSDIVPIIGLMIIFALVKSIPLSGEQI